MSSPFPITLKIQDESTIVIVIHGKDVAYCKPGYGTMLLIAALVREYWDERG